jgi:hypothetical protein
VQLITKGKVRPFGKEALVRKAGFKLRCKLGNYSSQVNGIFS